MILEMGLLLKFKKGDPAKWALFLKHAVDHYKDGNTLIFPKGKTYHLGGNPFDIIQLNEVLRLYSDELNMGVPLVVNSIETAEKLVQFSPLANKLVKKFWPGDLILCLPQNTKKDTDKEESLEFSDMIYNSERYISVEWNADSLLQAFLDQLAENGIMPIMSAIPVEVQPGIHPVDTTSIMDFLGTESDNLILDIGKLAKPEKSSLSTVVKITGKKYEILREGSISIEEIEEAL
jgi:tRNA A37 threonylcarbamoyladenosine synthetase subunit TsaC/SUA5/YrdC